MKVSKIESWQVSMPLKEPYSIAHETIDTATNVFLRIETDHGIMGYGCAAPVKNITGETADSVSQALNDVVVPSIAGSDPLRFAMLLERLKSQLDDSQSSVLAAVDMALLDILGKISGQPLWKLLGGFRDRMKTSVTIGILPEKETVEQAQAWVKQGFKCLKLKGGIEVEADIARVLKVREVVGDKIELRFDANQGYSVEETIRFAECTSRAELEFIEQPTPKGQPDLLGNVTHNVQIPVMADESLITLRDALYLANRGLVDMVNVKLMKVGGISEALQIDAVARSADLEVMVGCMDESALAIAAGLHFALARPNVMYADLDGHLELLNDPSHGAVIIRDGMLFLTHQSGLGFDLP